MFTLFCYNKCRMAEGGPIGKILDNIDIKTLGRRRKTSGGRHRRHTGHVDTTRPEIRRSPSHASVLHTDEAPTLEITQSGLVYPPLKEADNKRIDRALTRLDWNEKLDAKVEAEKEGIGCVVRTVESIVGAPATREEVLERVRDYDYLDGKYKDDSDIEASFQEDGALIESYYNRIRGSHNTRLGRALRGYNISKEPMTAAEIQQSIQEGRKVAVLVKRNQDNKLIRHIAHVDFQPERGFISLSDRDSQNNTLPLPLNTSNDAVYPCFVFDKVSEGSAQRAA